MHLAVTMICIPADMQGSIYDVQLLNISVQQENPISSPALVLEVLEYQIGRSGSVWKPFIYMENGIIL